MILKEELKKLIKKYELELNELDKEYDKYEEEWEAYPSGEANPVSTAMHLTVARINSMVPVVNDLKMLMAKKYNGEKNDNLSAVR